MIKQLLKHRLRSGIQFRSYLSELEKTQKYSPAELLAYQFEKFSGVLKTAYEHVPYYRSLFRKNKLTLQDFRSADDLKKLPLLDKHIVSARFTEFRNTRFRGMVFKGIDRKS